MMERIDALKELLAKVEAGETPEAHRITAAFREWYHGDDPIVFYVRLACDGPTFEQWVQPRRCMRLCCLVGSRNRQSEGKGMVVSFGIAIWKSGTAVMKFLLMLKKTQRELGSSPF